MEFRGTTLDTDHLLYTWLRCHLVHEATLPPDTRIDHDFADPTSLSIRAGGPPEYTVLLSWAVWTTSPTKPDVGTAPSRTPMKTAAEPAEIRLAQAQLRQLMLDEHLQEAREAYSRTISATLTEVEGLLALDSWLGGGTATLTGADQPPSDESLAAFRGVATVFCMASERRCPDPRDMAIPGLS